MNPSLHHVEQSVEQKVVPSIIELFELYVDQQFGPDVWDALLTEEDFKHLIGHYYPRYGTVIFSETVKAVSKKTESSIKFILADFGVYYRSIVS